MEGPMLYVDCFGEPPLLYDKEEVAQAKELWEEVIVDSKDSTDDDDCFGEPPLLDDKEEVAQAKELWEEVIVDSKDSTDDDESVSGTSSDTSSITSEDLAAYNKQVFESDGFDVDSYPGFAFGMIRPSDCSKDKLWDRYSGYAEFAIKEYNKKKDKNFKVVGIEKTNIKASKTVNYYITFAAVDEKAFDDEPKMFQGLVARGPKYDIVKLCRQKGDPSEGYSRVAEV